MTFFERYVDGLRRWYVLILLISVALGGVGAYYSVKLYANLRTDLEELLPENAQSVKDVKAVTSRIAGLNHLSIVIQSINPEAALKFQKDVAAELRKLPPTLVARVEDNILKEKEFFTQNKALYVDLNDWRDIDQYIADKIRFSKRKKNPFNLNLLRTKEDAPEPQYDFKALEKKYEARAQEANRFSDGYFQTRDGTIHVVLAFLPGKVTDEHANEALSKAAHDIVAKLDPQKYDRKMLVGFDGDVQNLIEEHEGLVEDLALSTIVVLLLVTGALLLYFRSFFGVTALSLALFMGTFITFGVSFYIVGYLNANTAFLGSIVIGNGINFGIIMLARYFEERRRGVAERGALLASVKYTAQATGVAACAAGISYASLMLTDFRGFNQFGIIGGLGMIFCWLATFTTLPALLVAFERWGLLQIKPASTATSHFFQSFALSVTKHYKGIVFLTVISAIVSTLYCVTLDTSRALESDFSKLRNKKSLEQGAGFWGKKVDEVFERYLTPTVILTESPQDAQKVLKVVKAYREQEGDKTPISSIQTIEDFLPQDQEEKIKIIEHIQAQLTPQVRARMRGRDRERVEEYLPTQVLEVLTVDDLPEGIKVHFREQDGSMGRMVHVYPQLQQGNFWDGREVIRFATQLRQAIKEAGVRAVIAGQPPLSADLIGSIEANGPRTTMFALLMVSLLVVVVFRRLILIRSVLGALFLGVLWMVGIMAAFDLKINFLNFIALPITFGIGVDYAVNIFARYRSDHSHGNEGLVAALQHTGSAVALCSLTTIIGYSSLLLAGSQAFVSFGTLAVLGEFTCIVAALVSLPALWMFKDAKRRGEKAALEAVSDVLDHSEELSAKM